MTVPNLTAATSQPVRPDHARGNWCCIPTPRCGCRSRARSLSRVRAAGSLDKMKQAHKIDVVVALSDGVPRGCA